MGTATNVQIQGSVLLQAEISARWKTGSSHEKSMAAARLPPAPPGFLDDEKLEEILIGASGDVSAGGNAEESHDSSGGGMSLGSSARAVGSVVLAATKGDRSFEAVHRGRYLPSGGRDEWQQHRADVLSGDRLKPWVFAKGALYELFPGFVSVWLILIFEGGNHNVAANRNLTPFKKFPLGLGFAIVDMLALAPYVSFVLWLYYRPPGVDVWEVGFTFCFPFMRSLVVGAKYGYYTDLECDAEIGFGGKNYEVEDRMNKKLASNWVCNLHDQLYSVLVEELYETSIRVDCDLAKTSFDVGVPAATAVWAEAKVTLAKALAEAARPGTGFESEKVQKQKWGFHQDLQLKVFGPEKAIKAMVETGKLPASLIAWKCACDCYYVDASAGRKRFFWLMLASMVMSAIAPMCRLLLGRSAFGDTGPEHIVLGLGMLASVLGFFLMLLYVVAPRWDHASRYHAAQFMCDLMGDGIICSPSTQTAETAEEGMTTREDRYELRPRYASGRFQGAPDQPRLLLDMRQSQNVLAWSLVRRSVACAGEFGHSFYLRFQVYSFLLFGGSCVFVTAMTFASKSSGTMGEYDARDRVMTVSCKFGVGMLMVCLNRSQTPLRLCMSCRVW